MNQAFEPYGFAAKSIRVGVCISMLLSTCPPASVAVDGIDPLAGLPRRWGEVTEWHGLASHTKPPDVILIQDLHVNRSVQRGISRLLGWMDAKPWFPEKIAVEGASGDVAIAAMQRFPDERRRRQAADYLLRVGEMPGDMHFAVSAGRRGVYGVEDRSAYASAVSMYRRAYHDRRLVEAWLAAIEKSVPEVKMQIAMARDLIETQVLPEHLGQSLRAAAALNDLQYLMPPEIAGAWQRATSAVSAFYALALMRDEAMVENAVHLRKAEGQKTTVLIMGGFHTPGVTRRLRGLGLSYAVVTPRLRSHTRLDRELYVRRLLGRHVTLDEAIRGEGVWRHAVLRAPLARNLDRLFIAYANGRVPARPEAALRRGWSAIQNQQFHLMGVAVSPLVLLKTPFLGLSHIDFPLLIWAAILLTLAWKGGRFLLRAWKVRRELVLMKVISEAWLPYSFGIHTDEYTQSQDHWMKMQLTYSGMGYSASRTAVIDTAVALRIQHKYSLDEVLKAVHEILRDVPIVYSDISHWRRPERSWLESLPPDVEEEEYRLVLASSGFPDAYELVNIRDLIYNHPGLSPTFPVLDQLEIDGAPRPQKVMLKRWRGAPELFEEILASKPYTDRYCEVPVPIRLETLEEAGLRFVAPKVKEAADFVQNPELIREVIRLSKEKFPGLSEFQKDQLIEMEKRLDDWIAGGKRLKVRPPGLDDGKDKEKSASQRKATDWDNGRSIHSSPEAAAWPWPVLLMLYPARITPELVHATWLRWNGVPFRLYAGLRRPRVAILDKSEPSQHPGSAIAGVGFSWLSAGVFFGFALTSPLLMGIGFLYLAAVSLAEAALSSRLRESNLDSEEPVVDPTDLETFVRGVRERLQDPTWMARPRRASYGRFLADMRAMTAKWLAPELAHQVSRVQANVMFAASA